MHHSNLAARWAAKWVRVPTVALLALTSALFTLVVSAAALLIPVDPADEALQALGSVSAGFFIAVASAVAVAEALVWTIGFIEIGEKAVGSAAGGAIAGMLGYSLVFHWSTGWSSVVTTMLLASVLNLSYLVLRTRSRLVGVASTVVHKVAFVVAVAACSSFAA